MVTLEGYEQAERELALAEGRLGFRIHAAVYAVVVTGLIVLNVLLAIYTDATFIWVPFVAVGWGIGLLMHYLHGVRWAEREMRQRQALIERRAAHLT